MADAHTGMARWEGWQDYKPTNAPLSSTDTSMELAQCCPAQTGCGSWVCELLHHSLPTSIVTPVQAYRCDSSFPSSWTSKDAHGQGSRKERALFLGCQAFPPPLLPPPVPTAWGSFEVGWQGTQVKSQSMHFCEPTSVLLPAAMAIDLQ